MEGKNERTTVITWCDVGRSF